MHFNRLILKKLGLTGLPPILRWVVILPFFIGFCLWGVLITAIASPRDAEMCFIQCGGSTPNNLSILDEDGDLIVCESGN